MLVVLGLLSISKTVVLCILISYFILKLSLYSTEIHFFGEGWELHISMGVRMCTENAVRSSHWLNEMCWVCSLLRSMTSPVIYIWLVVPKQACFSPLKGINEMSFHYCQYVSATTAPLWLFCHPDPYGFSETLDLREALDCFFLGCLHSNLRWYERKLAIREEDFKSVQAWTFQVLWP